MKRNEVFYLVGGLLLGFLLGAILLGTNDDLRDDLFGTAADTTESSSEANVADYAFYQAEFSTVKEWLNEQNEEVSKEISEDLASVEALSDEDSLQDYEDDPKVVSVLSTIGEVLEITEETATDETSICLGLDSNPYSVVHTLYLYLKIPSDMTIEVSPDEGGAGWEKLAGPKDDNQLWSTTCYLPVE